MMMMSGAWQAESPYVVLHLLHWQKCIHVQVFSESKIVASSFLNIGSRCCLITRLLLSGFIASLVGSGSLFHILASLVG